ncbi:Plasmodium exported protein, unknown function [Plasmodium malariae]|uniref:Pv-fam-d protein n=1 Tax=Plasmodium malariae TaxID=5858 RepID=A0A1A8WW01_PLAMA|nr:Plasmodium exported protein, unknown function [Plasmodium malariae]
MLVFFIKDFIFFCLIWILKYSNETIIYDKTWSEKLNRNKILKDKFNRRLCNETKTSVEDEYKYSKEKINDLKGKSTETFEKKPYALEHNNLFQKKDNESIYSDTYQEEMNYLIQRRKPQKHGASKFKNNLKEKFPSLERYDNIQNNKNVHMSFNKFPSKNDSSLFHMNSQKICNFFNYEDKLKATEKNKQKHSSKHENLSFYIFLSLTIFILLIGCLCECFV